MLPPHISIRISKPCVFRILFLSVSTLCLTMSSLKASGSKSMRTTLYLCRSLPHQLLLLILILILASPQVRTGLYFLYFYSWTELDASSKREIRGWGPKNVFRLPGPTLAFSFACVESREAVNSSVKFVSLPSPIALNILRS